MLKHKTRLGLLLMIVILLVTSGCSFNKKEADEVASLFADRLFYNENLDEYKETFSDSDLFNKRLKEVEADLQTNFATVFEPISGPLSLSEREDISKSLLDKVKETTSYTFTIDENKRKNIKVTYHIKGFDYANLVGMMMVNLLAHEDKIDIGSGDAKHIVTTAYYDSLEKSASISKSVDVSVSFKKDSKDKWKVDSSKTKEDDIQNLLFVFMTGKVHDENYEKEMLDEINKIVENEKNK